MKKYSIAATTDIGVSRERQEDYIFFKELDEKNLFCVIADGTGSRPSIPQPASIICLEIGNFIQTMWKNKKKDANTFRFSKNINNKKELKRIS